SPGGEAFNTSTGTLNVDYAGYLSKQDVVYNQPETTPTSGLTVGNGRMGAMVWSANGLTMQFNNVDGSEQAAYAAGLVNLYTSPGMDTGYTAFQQRLSLYNGTLTTTYDSNRTVTIMGEAGSEVMGIHVSDTRAGVTAVTLDLSLWNVSSVNAWDNGSANQTAWETVSTYADSTGIGLSRGQADSNNFGYTLAATVDGAAFTSQSVNSNLVRLNITPSSSYTIWIACASRLNAPSHNSLAQAKALLSSVTGTYSATLAAYQAWWHSFWAKSFVGYSNSAGDADYLENLYYLATYMIAAGGYGNYPFHFINGVFGAAGDAANWSNAYWYWNQRDVYNSFLASNHPDVMQTFNNMYSRNSAFLQSQTSSRYGLSGTWVPETMDWNGSDNGTIYSTYTDNIYSSGTEAAENMYRQYRYTNNYAYLTSTAYPFMKQVATFYANILAVNGGGQYYMPATVAGKYGDNAHETYWNVSNAITDLAAIRALYPHVIAAAQLQGVDPGLVTQWQNILANLSPYPLDPNNANQYAPCATPIPAPSNDENIPSELAWPYGVVGLDTPDLSFGVSNWNNRPFINDNIWTPDGIQAARLGLGDSAFASMKAIMTRYQNYPNGKSNNTNGVFEYLGVNLSAMNESLLQSYNEKIRVFPALPSDSTLSAKFTLAAQGGFLVSSECEAGSIKYVGITSLYGNPASVANPWNGQAAQVRRVPDNAILASGSGATFNFPTASNTVYVVEPVAQPLGSYGYEQITAAQNNDGKVMGSSVLGIFNGTAHNGGKYEAESGVLAGTAAVSGDSAASGGYEVTNIGSGASVSFTNVIAGNQLQIRYCTQSNPGKLDLYINGVLSQAVTFPTTNSWWTTYATVTVSVAIPAGATVKLQYDSGDAGTNLDFIQINTVGTTTPTYTPSRTATATPTPTPVVKSSWRINAGGPQYTDG
ncbi:MAG TPA: carbohydrate-binding domain-containing protein, partial [bacterium]|nr:carbohydrate-binding domain-containing protein [bacterium]